MNPRASKLILTGSLLLGFVACLGVTARGTAIGLTGVIAVTGAVTMLVVAGTAGARPRRPIRVTEAPPTAAVVEACPVDHELWRMIDEYTGRP